MAESRLSLVDILATRTSALGESGHYKAGVPSRIELPTRGFTIRGATALMWPVIFVLPLSGSNLNVIFVGSKMLVGKFHEIKNGMARERGMVPNGNRP